MYGLISEDKRKKASAQILLMGASQCKYQGKLCLKPGYRNKVTRPNTEVNFVSAGNPKGLTISNVRYEHTHRSALKALVEQIVPGIVAINEPRRIECGAPDFVIGKGSATIGHVEAKDVGKSLDEANKAHN